MTRLMNRPVVGTSLLLWLVLAWFLDPDRIAWWVPSILFVHFCIGTWGVLDLRLGFWGPVVTRSEAGEPKVALTYDDGPDPNSTPALLDLLRDRGVHATFFCVGSKVRAHPELTARIHAEGHVVGNHSDGHAPWTMFYSKRRMRRELLGAQDSLKAATGVLPRYFRPPYGHSSHVTGQVARALDLPVIAWSLRGLDMPWASSAKVIERVLARIDGGDIVLLHDGGRPAQKVVETTVGLLDGLEARGLRAVRLDELLGD